MIKNDSFDEQIFVSHPQLHSIDVLEPFSCLLIKYSLREYDADEPDSNYFGSIGQTAIHFFLQQSPCFNIDSSPDTTFILQVSIGSIFSDPTHCFSSLGHGNH
jgi:hypothetical protein